jgi:predicted metal-dependent enzyme (double-stranded beta helix superfamily)
MEEGLAASTVLSLMLRFVPQGGIVTFNLDHFVSDCRDAIRQDASSKFVREIVARAVSDPRAVLNGLGEPNRGEINRLYRSHDLTILNVVWAPWMTLLPHNHQMWAVIGIYTGREDNIFWRRVGGTTPHSRVEAVGAKALAETDAVTLGQDVIHSVTNPIPRLTGAIHVYGGDFFDVARSEWDAETLLERRTDGEKMAQRFEEANALWKLSAGGSSKL